MNQKVSKSPHTDRPNHQGLVVRGICHRYDNQSVLSDVSFALAPGEHLAVMGPSGCGKSTILRLIAGLEELQTGTITLNDQILASGAVQRNKPDQNVPPERRGVGMVFQDHALFPHLSVLGNVLFPLHRLPAQLARQKASKLLSSVGLAELSNRYPKTLSGGQRQRLALARSLAQEPEILLLDEPFTGLDPSLRADLKAQTKARLREKQIAAVLVTHDPAEALWFGDRVLVMRNGAVEQVGSPEELRQNPLSLDIARLIWDVRPLVTFSGSTCTQREFAAALSIDDAAFCNANGASTAKTERVVYATPSALLPAAAANLAQIGMPIELLCSVNVQQIFADHALVTLEIPCNNPTRSLRVETTVPTWLLNAAERAQASDPIQPETKLQRWVLDPRRVFFFSPV